MIELGVNIDHVATVRQARRTVEPDPARIAVLAELGGANSITVHLREDRRHIQDRDVRLLKETMSTRLNLEMAVGEDILDFALDIEPQQVCLVPEKREELTTEGGLALASNNSEMRSCIEKLQNIGSLVSLFIEPDPKTIDTAKELGAHAVELHTGTWANAFLENQRNPSQAAADRVTAELIRLEIAAEHCAQLDIRCHAGHGITYQNVHDILHLRNLRELNIGHCIVSHALFVGMERAVAEMKNLLKKPHK